MFMKILFGETKVVNFCYLFSSLDQLLYVLSTFSVFIVLRVFFFCFFFVFFSITLTLWLVHFFFSFFLLLLSTSFHLSSISIPLFLSSSLSLCLSLTPSLSLSLYIYIYIYIYIYNSVCVCVSKTQLPSFVVIYLWRFSCEKWGTIQSFKNSSRISTYWSAAKYLQPPNWNSLILLPWRYFSSLPVSGT